MCLYCCVTRVSFLVGCFDLFKLIKQMAAWDRFEDSQLMNRIEQFFLEDLAYYLEQARTCHGSVISNKYDSAIDYVGGMISI